MCVLENVYGFLTKKFAGEHDLLCQQLESLDYDVQTFDIDAASCGIPTLERHIWIVAASNGERLEGNLLQPVQNIAQLPGKFQRSYQGISRRWAVSKSRVGKLGEGVSEKLDAASISKREWHKETLKAFGNAIIPQVTYGIFHAIHLAILKHLKVSI